MRLEILRKVYSKKQTTGTMNVIDDTGKIIFTCHTLELDDDNNKKKESCVPTGVYQVEKRKSLKYGQHFWIKDVPNRSMILIHHGNYHTDILGCILVGKTLVDINGDGYKDVTSSKDTMKKLVELLPDSFELMIKKV